MQKSTIYGVIMIFLLVGMNRISRAQTSDSIVLEKDENYVYNSRRQITVSIIGLRFFNGLYYTAEENISYRPTIPNMLGIGLAHKWLNVNIGIIGLDGKHTPEKDSGNFQLQASVYFPRFGFDFIFVNNTGFFVGNHQHLDHIYHQPNDIVFKDMKVNRYALNALVMLTKKFNLNESFGAGKVAHQTFKGWFINPSFSHLFIGNGDQPLIADSLSSLLSNSFVINEGRLNSMAVLPGYAWHKVWHGRLYASVAPAFGPTFQYIDMSEYPSGKLEQTSLSFKGVVRLSFGYHTNRWVFGGTLLLDTERFYLGQQTTIINSVGKAMVKVGYKFQVPKWAKKYSKNLDAIETKVKELEPGF
jgi:hypothetical protein